MDKRKNWNGSIVHWIYQKFRLVSAGEKARWKKKEKERRTIDTIVDKATHRETRRLMLFSHLSAKNPTRLRHHVVLSISAIPRADHKANIIAPSILSMEFIYLTSNQLLCHRREEI